MLHQRAKLRICGSNVIYHIYHGSDPGLYQFESRWYTWLRKRTNPQFREDWFLHIFFWSSYHLSLYFRCTGWSLRQPIHPQMYPEVGSFRVHILCRTLKTWLHSSRCGELLETLCFMQLLPQWSAFWSVLLQVMALRYIMTDGKTDCFPSCFLPWWFAGCNDGSFI